MLTGLEESVFGFAIAWAAEVRVVVGERSRFERPRVAVDREAEARGVRGVDDEEDFAFLAGDFG